MDGILTLSPPKCNLGEFLNLYESQCPEFISTLRALLRGVHLSILQVKYSEESLTHNFVCN